MEQIKQFSTKYYKNTLSCQGEEYDKNERFATFLETGFIETGCKKFRYRLPITIVNNIKVVVEILIIKTKGIISPIKYKGHLIILNQSPKEERRCCHDILFNEILIEDINFNKNKYIELILKIKFLLSNLKYCVITDKLSLNVKSIDIGDDIFNSNNCS